MKLGDIPKDRYQRSLSEAEKFCYFARAVSLNKRICTDVAKAWDCTPSKDMVRFLDGSEAYFSEWEERWEPYQVCRRLAKWKAKTDASKLHEDPSETDYLFTPTEWANV